jgi:predicted metalloendopeptidase
LRVGVEDQLHAILDRLAAAPKDSAGASFDERRVRDFYAEGMNVEKRNRLGLAPLADLFAKIDGVKNGEDLAAAIGYLQRMGARAWWAASPEQDEKKSEIIALHLYQGGRGLPDRDYYLNDDEKSKKIRADYLAYVAAKLNQLHDAGQDVSGWGDANSDSNAAIAAAAAGILEIETQLARASMTRVELRDVEKLYNKTSPAELAVLAPRVSWGKYFEAIGLPSGEPRYLIVGQPKFFAALDQLFETMPLERMRTYLKWHAFGSMASFLTEEFERQSFDFYARTFNGAKEMKPLWRRVLGTTNGLLDEMLGKLYVRDHFNEDAKRKINHLVDHLTAAYAARIMKLDWMSDATKKKAIEKLNSVSRKLGYPDVWKDMAALEVGTDSYAQNVMRACRFEFDRKIKEVGGPVNRDEWFMPPQMVNAYYQPPLNEIAFPAAILQPPFFDPSADDAVNFGGIGTTIGHELTHGLDDQGALFDAHGNLNNWWTPEDKRRFDGKTAHLAEQFDAYEVLPGVRVNGKLTLGENIADLGGMYIALDGLRLALAEQAGAGAAAAPVDDLSPVQRFFMNYAVTERGQIREELQRLYAQIDPHSPSRFRVNGPASNMPEFYEAFKAKQGDKLWREPDDRVAIW